MSKPEYIDPSSCPSYKTYTGVVKTSRGYHQRILQRRGEVRERLWVYYRSPEEGGPMSASDAEVSRLEEVDPFVNDEVRVLKQDAENLRDELDKAEKVIQTLKRGMNAVGVPEERVREIVREELGKTQWTVHGMNIAAREDDL